MIEDGGIRPFRLGHQPALDGMRGLCILVVLLFHGEIPGFGDGTGLVGVNTFFVLSGFLITSLLITEWDTFHDIRLLRFYCRRGLRLLPALVTMLVVVVAYSFAVDPHKRAIHVLQEALRALFYCTNWAIIFTRDHLYYVGHTWSLSVEEHFYLVWPAVLLFMLRKTTRSSLLCWIVLALVVSVLVRAGVYLGATYTLGDNVLPVEASRYQFGTDTRADSLLLGCLAAALLSSQLFPQSLRNNRGFEIGAWAALVGLGLLASRYPFTPWMICAGWFFYSVCAVIPMVFLATSSGTLMHRVLSNRALVFMGQISYGLYIWHAPIIAVLKKEHYPWANLAYLVPVFSVAVVSYYLIERPCLRLKERFAMVR
jgi:peptidoglycan/LPS O-acetylase OafA/YrhL